MEYLQPTEKENNIDDHHQDYIQRSRDRREKIKQTRLKAKYIKRANIFLQQYDQLESNLKAEILSCRREKEIMSICYLFGASPASPKEVYLLRLPKGKIFICNF